MNAKTATLELAGSLAALERLHSKTFELLLECRRPPNGASNEDLVDMAFLMRNAAKLSEDLRKELEGAKRFLEKVICIRWLAAAENINVHNVDMCVRGRLATGTPQVKTTVSLPLPERNPVEYVAFMKRIGVFGSALKRNLVRLHWPAVTEYLSDLLAKGKPLPPGLDPNRTYSVYQVVLRKNKDD